VEELEGVEHREMLSNRLFFRKLIEYVAEKPDSISSPKQLTQNHKTYMNTLSGKKDQVYLDDIADDDETDATETRGAEEEVSGSYVAVASAEKYEQMGS